MPSKYSPAAARRFVVRVRRFLPVKREHDIIGVRKLARGFEMLLDAISPYVGGTYRFYRLHDIPLLQQDPGSLSVNLPVFSQPDGYR